MRTDSHATILEFTAAAGRRSAERAALVDAAAEQRAGAGSGSQPPRPTTDGAIVLPFRRRTSASADAGISSRHGGLGGLFAGGYGSWDSLPPPA